MIFADISRRAGKLVADNSPVILSAIAVTGTVMTAVLTGKASFKAALIIDENEPVIGVKRNSETNDVEMDNAPLDIRQKVDLVWKLYIPAAGTAAMTIFCTIAANRIGMRRAAALASAYKISEKAWGEYKDKVIETIGRKKEEAVRDEVAQDRVDNNPVSKTNLIVTGGGKELCFEEFTGRYFETDVQSLRKAQNDINHQVNNSYYASLTDFYDLIGLPRTSLSDEFGWNSDELLELEFSTTMSKDERPCISIGFRAVPIRDYHRVH